jgi:hypothetical protein
MSHPPSSAVPFNCFADPLANRESAPAEFAVIAQIVQDHQRVRLTCALLPHLPESLVVANPKPALQPSLPLHDQETALLPA